MARVMSFQAEINFQFASHAEMTDMRTKAKAFANNNGGTCKIVSNEPENVDETYIGILTLKIPVSSRADAAAKMTTIDNALSTLPALTTVNGRKLRYLFQEDEV